MTGPDASALLDSEPRLAPVISGLLELWVTWIAEPLAHADVTRGHLIAHRMRIARELLALGASERLLVEFFTSFGPGNLRDKERLLGAAGP